MGEFKARFTAELDTSKVEQQIKNLENKKIKLDVDTGDGNKSVQKVDKSIVNAEKSSRTFGDTLKRSLNIGLAASITSKAFNAIRTAANEAVDAVRDFDSAIKDLRIATGGNYSDVSDLVKQYNRMGKDLSATTTEVSDSAKAWLRQGHSINESNTLIRDSMILSKVAELDSADATTYLTSAMKGYGIAANDVIRIVDKLTAVDLVSATDAGGLAEAMSRTAVTAKQMGVSMDQLIAYIAVTGEVTQKSMSSVGEAFKTIFSRMSDIKAGKLELIDEDGTVESISNLETVLNNLGIKLRDSNNEFRDSFAILSDVAAVWDDLGTVQQAALTKTLGGTRQAEIVRVLMENYDLVEKYANVAANSAGTAEKKFSAYLDSIEAKTKSLQAAFESLAINTISTESVGGIVDATASLVTFLDKTNLVKGALTGGAVAGGVKVFSLLSASISKAAIQMNSFNDALAIVKSGNVGADQIQKLAVATSRLSDSQLKAVLSSASLTNEQRIAILTANGMSTAEAQAALSAMGLAGAEGTATVATNTLSGAMKGLWATLKANPLVLIASAVAVAVSVFSTVKQKAEEARQAALEAGEAAKDETKTIRDLYGAYSDANTAYANNAGSKEDLTSATESLLSALGIEQAELDKLIEKYGNLDDAIQAVTLDSLQKQLNDMTSGYKAAKDELEEAASSEVLKFTYRDSVSMAGMDVLKSAGYDVSSEFGYSGSKITGKIAVGDNSTVEGMLAMYDNLLAMRDTLDSMVGEIYTREEMADSALYQEIDGYLQAIEAKRDSLVEYIESINETVAQLEYIKLTGSTGIPETKEEYDALLQTMIDGAAANGNYVGSQEQIIAAITNMLAAMPELNSFVSDYIEELSDIPDVEPKKLSFGELIADTDDPEDYIDQINDYVEKVEFLKKKLEMVRDGSLFEPENATDLADMYEMFPSIAMFDDVEAGIIDAINSLWRTVDEETGEMTGGLDKVFVDMFKNLDTSQPENVWAYVKFTSALSTLFETAEEGTPIFKDLSDAISGVGSASDLISTIQEEMADSGQITLDTLGKMAKEFGSDIGNYFTIDSDGKIIAKVGNIKSHYIDAIKEMELEDKVLEKSLIDALDNGFNEADYNFESLTNAMSKAQEVASIAANAQKEISYDTVESLRSIFGQDFENYIITDEAGNYIAANVEELRNYARGLLEAGNASDATLAQFDSMWQSTLDGTKEAETALDRLSKALSNVNDVSSYLTLLQSDDLTFVDALEQAVKLLESMGDGYSLDDFFAFGDDGSITYKTEALTDWINSYIDSMVTAGDVSKELADQMKAAAKAEVEQVNAIEKLTDAMSKVEKASDLIGKAQEEVKENGKNSLETVMSLYEQFGEKANTMFTPSGDGGFIINTNLIKQELYKLIDEVEAATPEIKQAMKDALDVQLEEEEFNDVVDEYVSKVQTLKEALETLRSDGKLSDSALYDLVKEFPELATQTDNLGEAITNLIGTMNTDMISKFNEQFGKIDSEEDRKELEAFMEIVLKLGEVVGETQFAIDINAEVEGMQNLFDAMKESVSATGLTAQSVTNLKQRYQELDSYDPAKLFERTENGIHLNTKALRELESEYETIAKGKISETYDELIQQYEDLTEEIDRVGTTASTVDLYAQRDKILQQINETAELAAQYAGLTSNFHKWEEAQSIGEEGDMYDSLTGSLKDIKQLYQDGLIGTNKFRTAVQLMSNEDLSNATADELIAAYEAGYPKMERYFKDSSKGVSNFLKDVQKLNSEWAHQNEDGSWEIDFGIGGDQEIADALGINVEAVQAIMRKLSDYGFDINLDTMYSSFETMQSKAEKAASKLKELGKTDVDFNFNATNIERVDEQIKSAKETLEQFKDEDGKIDLSAEGAQEAQYVLATLILQKQELEQPTVMQIDAGNVDGAVGETLRKLQKLKQDYNNLQVQAAIGADVTGLESSINSTLSSFTPDEIEILGKLGIDTNATAEEINTAIAGITPEMLVSIGVDESAVTAFAGQNHDTTATVVYNVDGSKVSRYSPPRKSSTVKYTAYLESWTPPDKYGTVYYTAKMRSSGSTTGGTTGDKPKSAATGTAYAGGTSGDWGTKGSGTALGGELGTEILVRRGKFFTIGENGAEFFKYKKGDIIFNHKQTEQLFKHGRITSAQPRGKALAEGTAFSSGSGSITGGGSTTTRPSGSGSGSGDSDDNSTIIDWIEIAIDRIERAINRLGSIAQSGYKALAKRLRADDDQIQKVIQEIDLQNKAYARYNKEAESVGLSSELKLKVQNGTIDINEYDEETAKLIEDYQKWYEKAQDCADAIDELHESLASLWEEKFNTIATDYDNQLSLIEHRTSMFDSKLSEIEARGYLGGSELYTALIDTETEKTNILKAQLADLTKAMSDAVNSGEIEVGSEAWYAMQVSINDTKMAIQESTLAVVEFNNALREMEWKHFDYLQDRISQITKESDFLINLMSNSDLYTDNGQLSETGMATMGLHGVNYNTYLAQADKYAEEIKKLNSEIANDPYNTTLIERREELLALQQESISAAEAEKQAIVSMVEEGINLELSSLKELIDAYTESLESSKDLYDYQKKVKKQTAEVASLQKQLAAYQNDTSEENRARLQKLQVDLNDALEDLEETQYDRYIKEQKQMLDDFYDDYEENLNSRLDDVDALISDMIANVNRNSSSIADTIKTECASVGYTMSQGMSSIWTSGGAAKKTKQIAVNRGLKHIQKHISADKHKFNLKIACAHAIIY